MWEKSKKIKATVMSRELSEPIYTPNVREPLRYYTYILRVYYNMEYREVPYQAIEFYENGAEIEGIYDANKNTLVNSDRTESLKSPAKHLFLLVAVIVFGFAGRHAVYLFLLLLKMPSMPESTATERACGQEKYSG